MVDLDRATNCWVGAKLVLGLRLSASATPRERVVDPGDVWWTLMDSWGRPPEPGRARW